MTIKCNHAAWETITKDKITAAVNQVRDQVVNKNLAVNTLHKLISAAVKRYINVRVRKKLSSKTDRNCIYIGGLYWSTHDQLNKPSIELRLQYNSKDATLTLDSNQWAGVVYAISDTILHELIHLRQFRNRKFQPTPQNYVSNAATHSQRVEQEYLGTRDELSAYGFNIACALLHTYSGSRDDVISYLDSNPVNDISLISTELTTYLDAFNYDYDHKVISRLKKLIVAYINRAKTGYPLPLTYRFTQR